MLFLKTILFIFINGVNARRRSSLSFRIIKKILIKNFKYYINSIGFFIGCIVLALEYLAENKIIHRDIKPENLVIDNEGFLRLTDFGIARV